MKPILTDIFLFSNISNSFRYCIFLYDGIKFFIVILYKVFISIKEKIVIALFCDDQNSVHTFLEKSINWKIFNVDKILHAHNGEHCLELLKTKRPDLLLLDIRMPKMTGIDILKEMSLLKLNTTTIILSAYSDFIYAKEALKLGAFDYELKPIDSGRLTQILSRAVNVQMERYTTFLYKLLSGNTFDNYEIPDPLRRLGILSFLGILCVLPCGATPDVALKFREYLQEYYKYIIPLNDTELFILYPVTENDYQQTLASVREQHKELCQLMADSSLKFSVSHMGKDIAFLTESLMQCRRALRDEFYSGSGFFAYQEHQPADDFQSILLRYRKLLYSCLTNANGKNQIPGILDKMFEFFTQNRIDFDELTDICFNILYYNISVILNQDSEIEYRMHREMKECRSADELRTLMEDTLIQRFFNSASGVAEKTPLQNVRSYLEQNFAENISLEHLSKKFFISKYALCRGFRQEYQEGLWDFLKRLRMEHARTLLSTTDLKIYEAAEQCGFTDANYFSSAYRKYYGHTPFQEKKNR